jgi:hypothetical protein
VDLPYVRLRPEDLRGTSAIWGWTHASPELVTAIGLPPGRPLRIPLAGARGEGPAHRRRQAREGLASLLAVEPSHPDRTLYLEVLQRCHAAFERWLERRVARAFTEDRPENALREAVVAVNLHPGRAEARYNLALLLTRIVSRDPAAPDSGRWAALARGEFMRAAELEPELFWGHYHRGVLAFEAHLPEAATSDWLRFLDRFFADKPAPGALTLPLQPLTTNGDGEELPGLAYAVLLDYLTISLKRAPEPA